MANPSFENDCREIFESWGRTGWFNQLVRVLGARTRHERQHIGHTYKAMYGEELLNLFERHSEEDHGVSKEICVAMSMWMLEPFERDAVVVRDALAGQQHEGETNYKALVEILVGRKSSQVMLIKQAYYTRFRRQLDQDIINIEPPHAYRRILVALAASHKAHHEDVSQHIAKCDARRLYETGEGNSSGSIEEGVVLEILSKRSIPQLKLTLSYYNHIYGCDYSKSLKKRRFGEFENALRTVVQCIYKPPNYYAKMLNESMKAADKAALTRIILSREEIDLDEIQSIYKKKYGIELKDDVCERISFGAYRDFLTALLSTNI